MLGISKKTAIHTMFFGLVGAIILQSHIVSAYDQISLLHQFLAGDEVKEGPLSPSAYAQVVIPDSADASLMTFDDPAVTFAQTLEGNAIVAPMKPSVDQDGGISSPSIKKSLIYTVEDGDTIAGIASKYNISVNTVLWANGLHGTDVIKAGDHLTILPVTGVLHAVVSGDTVSTIADKYSVKTQDIIAFNGLDENARVSIGQSLIIPNGDLVPEQAPRIVSRNTKIDRDAGSEPTPPPQRESAISGTGFAWPTTSKHMSQYFKGGHTGIDIDNRSRPSVFAAQNGTVEFNGWLGGYGNLIIINHGNGLTTYYAHLDKFYVAKGAKVAKGDAIGKMGSTGYSTGPHVHFEVRRFGKPINPLGMY